MKLKKELGTEAVRDLVVEAATRVQGVPDRSLREPWPSARRVTEAGEVQTPPEAGSSTSR